MISFNLCGRWGEHLCESNKISPEILLIIFYFKNELINKKFILNNNENGKW